MSKPMSKPGATERSTLDARARLDLSGMALFVSIVEEGSLSAAGRALGLPKATVSRQLAQLERQAGAPLVARSTRSLTLTDAGRRHYERVRGLVREAQAAQAELVAGNAEPSGLMRVSVSATYGRLVIAPRILAFAARHPRLRVELDLSDERVNVVADGYDLVVRMGAVEDSELIGRRLADMQVALVASPGYRARAGAPTTPAELARHDAIVVLAWARPLASRRRGGADALAREHSVPCRRAAGRPRRARHCPVTGLRRCRRHGQRRPRPDPTGCGAACTPATALYARAAATSVAIRLLLDELQSLPAPDVKP